MKFTGYIKEKGLILFVMLLVLLVNGVFMAYLETAPTVILVVEVLFATGYAVVFAIDYIPKWKYYSELEETVGCLLEKTYLTEMIRPPYFYEGRIIHHILRSEEKYLNDIIAGQQTEMMEYYDYVQMWVHEIKTPVAAAKLIIENHKNDVTLSIEEEINKMEDYVEQMLYYAKSGSLAADYNIEAVSLKKVVAAVLKKNAKLITGRAVWPKLRNLDYEVWSDDKWLGFIIAQIVSNAVKYRAKDRDAELVFDAQKKDRQIVFTIRDNGIGIGQADLEHVFRKGYTGENGRAYKKSTGMGLYICGQLCEKMGIWIGIDSMEGEWTMVTLILQSA